MYPVGNTQVDEVVVIRLVLVVVVVVVEIILSEGHIILPEGRHNAFIHFRL